MHCRLLGVGAAAGGYLRIDGIILLAHRIVGKCLAYLLAHRRRRQGPGNVGPGALSQLNAGFGVQAPRNVFS